LMRGITFYYNYSRRIGDLFKNTINNFVLHFGNWLIPYSLLSLAIISFHSFYLMLSACILHSFFHQLLNLLRMTKELDVAGPYLITSFPAMEKLTRHFNVSP